MLRELELQDEIKQIQKSKNTDKHSFNTTITKYNDEIIEYNKQIKGLEKERDDILLSYNELVDSSNEWMYREDALNKEVCVCIVYVDVYIV